MPLALPSPSHPLSHQQDRYLHTDDINTPAPPVGHKKADIKNNIEAGLDTRSIEAMKDEVMG
jgi:hypothetical protein